LHVHEIRLQEHGGYHAIVHFGRLFLFRWHDIEDEVDGAVHFIEAAAEALPGIFFRAH